MSKSISTILRGISALALSVAGLAVFAGAASATYYASPSANHISMVGASDPTGSGSLTVSWLTPSSVTGSGITSYQVVTSNSDSTALVLCTTANAGPVGAVQSCTFTPSTSLAGASLYVRGVQSSGNLYSDQGYAAVATGNATVDTTGSVALAAPTAAAITGVIATNGLITVTVGSIASADQYLSTVAASKIVVFVGQTPVCTKTGPFTSATTSCTFSPVAAGLSLGISYGFTAKIYNAIGSTSLSGGTSATPVNTPSAPTNVTATKSATGSSVTVAWTAPSTNGGTVNTYTVSTFDGNSIYGCVGISTTTCTFSLYSASNYDTIRTGTSSYQNLPYNNVFVVTATTTTGATELTSTGISPVISLPAVPGPVASITSLAVDGSGTGVATWVAQAGSGTNGTNVQAETGYTVQLMSCAASYVSSCTDTGSPVRLPAGIVTYTFSGLTNGTYYTFKVSGYNAVGSGPTTTLQTPVVSASAVAATTGMVATIASVTNSSLTMSWTAPTNAANSAVSGYRVKLYQCAGDQAYTDGTNCAVQTLKTTTTTGTSYTFTGLTPAANNYYTATVEAINATGYSSPVQATPPVAAATTRTNTILVGGAPSAPTVTYSSAGVNFKWGTTATQFTAAQRLTSVSTFTIYDNTTGTVLCSAAVTALSCTAAKLTAGDSIVIYDTDASGISSLTAAVTGFGTANAGAVTVPTKVYNASVGSIVSSSDDSGNLYITWADTDTNVGYFLITALGSDGTSFTVNAENRTTAGTLLNFAVIPASKITADAYTYVVTPVNAVGTGAADAVAATNKLSSAAAALVCSLADTAAGCAAIGVANGISAFGPPAAPITVTASATTTTTLTFSWSAPTTDYFTTSALSGETGYPAITGYTGTLTATSGAVLSCTTTTTSCTFSGLTQGASYSFVVAANTALPAVIGYASTAVAAKANGVPSAPTITSVVNYSAAGTPDGSTTLVLFTGPADPGAALSSGFTSINNLLGDDKIYVSSTNGLAVGQALSGIGVSSSTSANNTIKTITGSTNANCTLTTASGPIYTLVNKTGSTACQNNAPVVGQLIVASTTGSTVLGQGDTIATVSGTYSSGWTITVTTPVGSSDTVVVGTGEAVTLYGFVTLAGVTTAPGTSLATAAGTSATAIGLINVSSTSGLAVGQKISNPTLITGGSTIASVVAASSNICTPSAVAADGTTITFTGTSCAAALIPGRGISSTGGTALVIPAGDTIATVSGLVATLTSAATTRTGITGATVTLSAYVTTTASVPVTASLSGVAVVNVSSTTGLVAGVLLTGTLATATSSTKVSSVANAVSGLASAFVAGCVITNVTTTLVFTGSACSPVLPLVGQGITVTGGTGSFVMPAGDTVASVTGSSSPWTVAFTTAPTAGTLTGMTVTTSGYLVPAANNGVALTSSSVVTASGAGTALTSSSLVYTSGTGNASAYVGTATNTTTAAVTYCTSVLTSTSSSCLFSTTSGSTYSFTMKAVNASGASSASAASVFTTAYMSTAPTAITAVRNGVAKEIQVDWTAPKLSNGAVVLSYIVKPYAATIYTLAEQADSTVCYDATTGLSTITGTSALCDFSAANAGVKFTVYAVTSAGNSQSSVASSSVAVLDVPAVPTGVVTITSSTTGVTVNWVAVTGATSYTISAVGGLTSPLTVTSTTNSYTFSYSQITKGGSYTFRVKATNSVGSSAYVTAAAETLADPTNAALIIENTSNTTANATGFYMYWTASAKTSNGGQPVTYTVVGNGVGVTTLTATTTGTSVWIPVTGLTALTTALYSWTLSASDASGSSTNSPLAVTTVTATNIAVPVVLTYGSTAGTNAQSSVLGTSGANSDVSEVLNATIPSNATYVTYTVTSSTGTTQACALGNTVAGAPGATTCILLGLTPGAAYSYSIVAGNGVTTSLPVSGYFVTAGNVTSAPIVTATSAAVSALGVESITVTWSAPAIGASSVTSYIAYVDTRDAGTASATPGSTNTFCTAVLTATSTSCTIYGLGSVSGAETIAPSSTVSPSNYYVYVAAVNPTGVSDFGTLANSVTGAQTATAAAYAAAQPVAPTKVIVASAGLGSLAVSWTASVAYGLPVTGYTVKATGSSTGTIVSCTTTTTSCTLTGITNTEVWTVAVYASNAYASNPTSSAGSVYAGVSSLTWNGWTVPAIAPVLTSAVSTVGTSMVVTWTAPVFSADATGYISAPITGYSVVATSSTGATATCGVVAADATTCTLTGLTGSTSYTIVVTPSNGVGVGNPGSITAKTVATTVAGAPTISGVLSSATGLQITWAAPVTTGGYPVLGYVVTATDALSGQQFTCPVNATYGIVLAPAVTCPINGLVVGSIYTISVQAATAAGVGAKATQTATFRGVNPEPIMATFLAVTAKQKSVSALSPAAKTALSGLISSTNDGAQITVTGYGTTKAIALARANAAANYLFRNGAAVHVTVKSVISKTVKTALVTVTSN